MICACHAQASTVFSVDQGSGTWSVESGGLHMRSLPLTLNGTSVLQGAKAEGNTYRKTIDGLDVSAVFGVVKRSWVQVALTVKNSTSQPISLKSVVFFDAPLDGLLPGVDPQDTKLYFENAIYGTGTKKDGDSYYEASLFAGDGKRCWMMGYRPPQMWTSVFYKESGRIRAYVELAGREFTVDPGETVKFDPLLLSAEFGVLDGFQEFGKFYKPYLPAEKAKDGFGFNTWDFYHGDITDESVSPALKSLSEWPEKKRVKYFILDDGWQNSRGNWTMDKKKFPEGLDGWVRKVRAAGFEPGVWVSPFWGDKAMIDKLGLTLLSEDPNDVVRYRLDPSSPKVKDFVYGQMRDLRHAGVKYFKIDFLAHGYAVTGSYKYSKYAPERVLREFYQGFRKAVGNDAYILGCGTTMASVAGVTDGARIMADITQNWGVLKEIYHFISYRYWMNGNMFVNDPDFFAVRGPGLSLPGAKNSLTNCLPMTGDRAYEGFTYDQAKTWATMILISGGNVTWSDEPQMMSPAAWDMFSVLLKNGGGHMGIPLDLLNTQYPTKWVRREKGRVYVALINVDSKPMKVSLSSDEVPEIAKSDSAEELFEHKNVRIDGGSIVEALPPYGSKCYALNLK